MVEAGAAMAEGDPETIQRIEAARQDPSFLAAVGRLGFAWGEGRRLAEADFETESQRLGLSDEEARQLLAELNSTRRPEQV